MPSFDARLINAVVRHDFTYPAPVSNAPVSSNLPTADPGLGGADLWSYTLQATDFATVSPAIVSFTNIIKAFISGLNSSGVNEVISYRTKLNGAQVATGNSSSITNAYRYTLRHDFSGVVAGDLIAVQLWVATVGMTYDYDCYYPAITYPRLLTSTNYIKIIPYLTGAAASVTMPTNGNVTSVSTSGQGTHIFIIYGCGISSASTNFVMSANLNAWTTWKCIPDGSQSFGCYLYSASNCYTASSSTVGRLIYMPESRPAYFIIARPKNELFIAL
jgi:hypothetical protein